MKRMTAVLAWLMILALLTPAAIAGGQAAIPEFVSFSQGRFQPAGKVEYDPCYMNSYECAYTEESRLVLLDIINEYLDAICDAGFEPLGKHVADFGRFGEYEQEAFWLAFEDSAELSPFIMNLVDVKTEPSHILFAIKDFKEQDKLALELFFSKEIVLEELEMAVPVIDFVPNAVEPEPEAEGVLLAEAIDAGSMQNVITADNAVMQDMVPYLDGGYFSYDSLSDSGNHNVRDFRGKKSDFNVLEAYVDMLLETNPYLELVEKYYKTYDDTFYSYGINYTGNVRMGAKQEQTYTDNECDVMIYGTIEGSTLKISVWTPKNMQLADLGYRYGGGMADTSVSGASALAGLMRLPDGSFQTTDGRLSAKLNEAMILRDGELYTTEANFERNEKAGRDRVWARYFYRNETVHFSYETRSLMTGDVLRLADMMNESSWLVKDSGVLEDEGDFTGYRWDRPFIGLNHSGDWVTAVNAPDSHYSDATVRVMYMDKEAAVYYVYAQFKTAPYEVEALIAVSLTDADPAGQADFTTYTGQLLSVPFSGRAFGAKYELFEWEIITGADLATISDTRSATCMLQANKPGAVGLRCSYEYGVEEPDVLTGYLRTVNKTKTYDVTVIIQ